MEERLRPPSTELIRVPTVFLRIGLQYRPNITPIQLYERTRGNWVMRPSSHLRVSHAMPVAVGIIREVYRIRTWL
ncbi:MAG: hypothetical protein JWP08_236, partial [Bryobacterales bacterium]|nr:hypothetical protein [Bryobacterales bacterium]